MVTVFTPTYNRAYIISKLYESLCSQTSFDFEWLVVDDGSSDNTKSLLSSFIEECKITIRYIHQSNGGKHKAINKGLQKAEGDVFFIVDSDDYLPEDAIEKIIFYFNQIDRDESFAGISGVRTFFSGERIGGELFYQVLDCTSLELRFKYNITGDMAEAFKTKVLRKYLFPEFNGERFCPEALIWNRIALRYKLRYTNEQIYMCEYRPDGLSAKIAALRMHSPRASMLYYSELYNMPVSGSQKIKAAINYWRFAFCSKTKFMEKLSQIGYLSLFLLPLGGLYHLKDKWL